MNKRVTLNFQPRDVSLLYESKQNQNNLFRDTHREQAHSDKTSELKKSIIMDI